MKEQLEKLKAELTEFIELSKTITPGEWISLCSGVNLKEGWITCPSIQDGCGVNNATFIARSRNISPAMAECLLVAVEGLEQGIAHGADFTDGLATITLQQIINLW